MRSLTIKQRILGRLYPFIMFLTRLVNKNSGIYLNPDFRNSKISFYSLSAELIDGSKISMEQWRGKKILIVNVASQCAYTRQYEELENLFKENEKNNLVILGFPSNDFKQQEPEKEDKIYQFCQINYGVTFPLFKKSNVVRPNQSEIYKWLSDKEQNGWNDKQPEWNFSKYLINEYGLLTHVLGPSISPMGREIKNVIRSSVSSS